MSTTILPRYEDGNKGEVLESRLLTDSTLRDGDKDQDTNSEALRSRLPTDSTIQGGDKDQDTNSEALRSRLPTDSTIQGGDKDQDTNGEAPGGGSLTPLGLPDGDGDQYITESEEEPYNAEDGLPTNHVTKTSQSEENNVQEDIVGKQNKNHDNESDEKDDKEDFLHQIASMLTENKAYKVLAKYAAVIYKATGKGNLSYYLPGVKKDSETSTVFADDVIQTIMEIGVPSTISGEGEVTATGKSKEKKERAKGPKKKIKRVMKKGGKVVKSCIRRLVRELTDDTARSVALKIATQVCGAPWVAPAIMNSLKLVG